MKVKNLIIGAGFAGAVLARRIVEESKEEVLIVENRSHIGGNAFDFHNEDGILVHKYGPHIFHTNQENVWHWLSRFTQWNHYQHRVQAFVDGMLVPLPISAETINQLYNLNLSCDQVEGWLTARGEKLPEIKTSEDVVVAGAGREIFTKFFKNYTQKQWGRPANQLDASVISRLPIRKSRDTRYFTDVYQGLPLHGYTRMFERILDHPKIRIMLNTDWFAVKDQFDYENLYYTGPLDQYFDFSEGVLEYRSMRFEYQTIYNCQQDQPVGTINYPNDYDFVRTTEFKHLTGQQHQHTTVVRDYPMADGEPYYIVPDPINQKIADQYRHLAAATKTIFVGRLAEYRYYNMDQIVNRALNQKLGSAK